MKFHLAINLERMSPETDMREVRDHTLEMVKMADAAGFEIAWAAEHHALEMTIAPNPFQILTWWGEHAKNIRLGIGVVNAAYWHPINLAGEAAMSRSVFAQRFNEVLGTPPIDYLTRWRMVQAERMLRDPRASVAGVMEEVGYQTEAAFRKAFKRVHGYGPGKLRRLFRRAAGG